MNVFARVWWLTAAVVLVLSFGLRAGHAESRFALVIGNSEYKTGSLATPANDAGLVADALTAAGFTVTGAANLDQPTLRQTLTEFINQVDAAGPDAVALVYLAGYGLQFNGDNYFVPVDANIQSATDVPLQAIRVSDFIQPLAALPAQVKIVILDAARENPFARSGGQPLASGLALVDPVPGVALAFNAAPGTIAPNEQGPYGSYATALTEMIGTGGLSLDDIFTRIRLRVSDLTQGAEMPWYVSGLQQPFFMTELAAGAPPPPSVTPIADIRNRPLRDFVNVDDAYEAVLELDTLDGYEQFLALYPNSPYAQRVAAMIAVRREEMIWRHCIADDTPRAYWSYLRRYPNGPHAWDARRRLAILHAAFEPPAGFVVVDFGLPPPPPAELVFVDRPVVVFAGRGWAPPPRPPVVFLPPRPHEFAVLPPPPRPTGRFALPVPAARVIPAFVRPPAKVVVRPAAPGPGGAGARIPVSLPKAVEQGHPPGGPGAGRPPAGGAPIVSPTHRGPPPPPPSASIKPAPTPPNPSAPKPAFVKPAPPPPHPSAPKPAVVKPAPPPPHPAPPKPAVVKPAPPPPHPAPPKPAVARPAPPPPKPPAKPACPPGKHETPQGCK
ncbi:MAG TPA: caspase domain-containing protein [Xanthobacteraceae bacterium]|nr:caspase domain-containing protein [Xanthobacteraceae bacterium]